MACALYLSPCGKRKDDIERMMSATGRPYKGVTAKWDNLSSIDFKRINSEKKGLEHTSKLDKVVLDKFEADPRGMFETARRLFEANGVTVGELDLESNEYRESEILGEIETLIPPGGYRETVANVRKGQDVLRRVVINAAKGECCVTKISQKELLVASHIKPWSACTPEEMTDIHNVLCLNRFHDALFDKHLMTVTVDDRIHYAGVLEETLGEGICESMLHKYGKISVNSRNRPSEEFLEVHNREFERKFGRIVA
ncbi:MAG: HNH endonuclease signature motif containing protein [Thermoplasmata archaeon]|nr:HNH endonuclease signature motif containing protein [Thermoplasmata archaeon]